MLRKHLGSSLGVKECPKWTFWLQSLQPICMLSGPSCGTFAARPNHLSNAKVRELTFAARSDPF